MTSRRLNFYTDWLDWGLGLSVDWGGRYVTIDFGPWDIELNFSGKESGL